jgi:dimethylargininase
VLMPAGFPGMQRTLGQLGYDLAVLDMSEFQKMDGGLSCLSLRF